MNTDLDIVIIGAGLSGIGTACQLSKGHPGKSFAILERRSRIGGTWDLFRYPGVRTDADMFTYSFKFRPWKSHTALADGDTVRQYIADTAKEYDVDKKIRFGLKITNANWSSKLRQWELTALEEATGEIQRYTCSFLISCTGYYNYDEGFQPNFSGLEKFKGKCLHPQQWPEDLDYTGKNIVVIGSGATAISMIPALTDKAAHVTMLQRSPSYLFAMPSIDKLSVVFSRLLPRPLVYKLLRKRNIFIQRASYKACRRWPETMRKLFLALTRWQLKGASDMRHFTPNYMPWDERLCVVLDGDLFDALKAGQASVSTGQIERFVETGLRLKSGELLKADIVITATGLKMQTMGSIDLRVDGEPRPLNRQMTYKCVLVEDVPNLACVFGYTNASWTLHSDIVGEYLCRLLSHMESNNLETATPHDRSDAKLETGMLDSLDSGYVRRGANELPRQGKDLPWKVLMDFERDWKMLVKDPIDDGVIKFTVRGSDASL